MRENRGDLYVVAIIFFVGLASFGIGRLSILWPDKEPIEITNTQLPITNDDGDDTIRNQHVNQQGDSANVTPTIQRKYVASKNGTAYHFPWCPGALNIKEENKVWFETKEEAELAGYKIAANCEGL